MCFYTDEQKANGKVIIFVGYDSQLEAHAIDLRCAKSGHVTKMSKADYSAKLTTSLIKIKTLAVREAGAMDPDLAVDLLLQTALVQLVHDGDSSLPLSIKPDARTGCRLLWNLKRSRSRRSWKRLHNARKTC